MNVAFVSYETPFAPCGGIAAVMGRLPAQFQAASRQETVVITPFHQRIEKTTGLTRSHEGSFGVPFGGRTVMVNIYRHDDRVPHYFLLPEDTRFFSGVRHPYDVAPGELLRDALFFGQAAASAVHVIAPGQRWHLLLQDWEAATAALALADHPCTHRLFLTLHNSYDCGVSADDLRHAGINPQSCPGHTILQRALALTEHTLFTVSEQFALDFTNDVLQSRVIAPQLQGVVRSRLVGIDNGPFSDLAVDLEILAEAAAGRFARLQKWKADNRSAFLAALLKFQPASERPLWGDVDQFQRDDAPWFVMAGRDDVRQKGYDVAARAAAGFLELGGQARFLFFPIPGDEGCAGLHFLEKLAQRFPQSVVVFPFLFREGFLSALRGAAFGVMPSLYEPFGMANEFYLNGTVAIGRATGGILQQIVPLRGAAAFGESVAVRAERWHAPSAQPTGLLFRERDGIASESADWQAINAAGYAVGGDGPDRVGERSRYALFQSMAEELRVALTDAVRLYRQSHIYYRMLTAGVFHIQQNFSWDRAAQEYVRHVI